MRLNYLYQVFLLVNESTVGKYQRDLADEIEPSINELIERAEQGLKALEKKESTLQTKVRPSRTYASYILIHGTRSNPRDRDLWQEQLLHKSWRHVGYRRSPNSVNY